VPVAPAEDIETVLGRFQAWTEAHHRKTGTPEPRSAEKLRRAASAKREDPGLREISYEEALKAVKTRRAPAAPKKAVAPPLRKPAPAAEIPAHAEVAQPKTTTLPKIALPKTTTPAKEPIRPQTHPRIYPQTPRPDFRQALARSMTIPSAALQTYSRPSASALVPALAAARPAVVSVRLAPEERDQMRDRAAEAGLSISAYVRQCALEVEELREQVRQMAETAVSRAAAPPAAISPAPGFWNWVRRRFSRPSAPGLVLRA
jgi:hypothetical protein